MNLNVNRTHNVQRAGLSCWNLFNWWRKIQRHEFVPGRCQHGVRLLAHPAVNDVGVDPLDHPLAQHEALHFEDTLAYEHVGLQPSTAVYTKLGRAAAKAGRQMSYRVVVSNFDAAFRVVAAGLGISVVPWQVSDIYVSAGQVRIIPLLNSWAERQFDICFHRHGDLTPAAERLVEFLCQKSSTE
jgi:DNA-binding transcriptional LysR family regulator